MSFKEDFICNYCEKKFSLKSNLKRHQLSCVAFKKNKENKEYEKKMEMTMKEYEKKMEMTMKEYDEKIKKEYEEKMEIIMKEQNRLKEEVIVQKTINSLTTDAVLLQNKLNTNNGLSLLPTKELVLNGIEIVLRQSDGYINATQLCKAGNKMYKNWFQNKNSESYLQALSASAGIPADDLIKYETGSNEQRATWVHRLVAIEIARWISPEFAVQVIRWTDELLLTGKVELGKEKTNEKLDDIYKKKISLNPIEFYMKDVVYIYEFEPIKTWKEKNKELLVNDRCCYEFGVTSDIEEREKGHKNDKMKLSLRLDQVFPYKNRFLASKVEAYIKKIVKELGLFLPYETKRECFVANEKEKEFIYQQLMKMLTNSEFEEEESCDDIIKETSQATVPREESFITLLKDKIITFEEYQKNQDKTQEIIERKEKNRKVSMFTEMFHNEKLSYDQYFQMMKEFC
jgi:hypothetical protein